MIAKIPFSDGINLMQSGLVFTRWIFVSEKKLIKIKSKKKSCHNIERSQSISVVVTNPMIASIPDVNGVVPVKCISNLKRDQ